MKCIYGKKRKKMKNYIQKKIFFSFFFVARVIELRSMNSPYLVHTIARVLVIQPFFCSFWLHVHQYYYGFFIRFSHIQGDNFGLLQQMLDFFFGFCKFI